MFSLRNDARAKLVCTFYLNLTLFFTYILVAHQRTLPSACVEVVRLKKTVRHQNFDEGLLPRLYVSLTSGIPV
jgi:hypothetical protein